MSCTVNEVTYFCDAFEDFSSLQVSVSDTETRKPKRTFTAVNAAFSAAQNWLLSFSPLTQQPLPLTLSGHLPGCVVWLVSLLWFLNGTRATIHDADQTVWSLLPNLKNKETKKCKTVQMKPDFSSLALMKGGGGGCLTVSALLMH